MSANAEFATGLAALCNWMERSGEEQPLGDLLATWAAANGWNSVGLVLPLEPKPRVSLQVKNGIAAAIDAPLPEWNDMAMTLSESNSTAIWQVPRSSGRLYSMIEPPGVAAGLIWAERSAEHPWKDADRNYMRLSARIIERSRSLAAAVGPAIDSERLRQRLADASIIAGRMAHDFDNILTGIVGFSDLSMPLLGGNPQVATYVQEISKVAQRGITFTQQLHQLSRSGQTKPQPCQVAAAFAKEHARLRGAMPAGLQCTLDAPAGLAAVAMETGPLQTVLGHLLENAVEACGPGGQVAVEARAVELNSSDAKQYLGQVGPGAHVEITVRDNGTGMKPEVRARLFAEPFYTTKVRHRGLGLAIVYRTLLAHRGGVRIDAATPPDSSTIVRVVIPLAAARPAVIAAATAGLPVLGGSTHGS